MDDPFSGLREWQKPHVKHLLKTLLTNKSALDASSTGCHAKGTPILMLNGKIKSVENIEVGDLLMGWDGSPRRVLHLSRGREEMAKVIPTKGDPFIVNRSHILTLVRTNTYTHKHLVNKAVDISVNDWLNTNKTWKHVHKLFRVPVKTWPYQLLDVDPYHLGVLLGDGCLLSPISLGLHKPDDEMRQIAEEIAFQNGVGLSHYTPKNRCEAYRFTSARPLWGKLVSLGLAGTNCETKFIPFEYKVGALDQRRKLLAGLLDTDGHRCDSGGYDFISKSKELSEGVAFVARSLGLAAYVKECRKGCQTGVFGTYWRVSISGDCSALPLRLPRKQSEPRIQKKSVLRTGFTVELLPEDDFYGFTLDGDGRFLMGDFTVTHNTGKTYCALTIAKIMGVTPFVLGPKGARAEWMDAAQLLGHSVEFHHYDQVRQREGPSRGENQERLPISNQWGEEVPWGSGSFWRWHIQPSFMVFDEVHKCGGSTSIQGKFLRNAPKAAEFVLCLSATAADNPKHLKNLGQVLGLFQGKDYYRWLMKNGCPPDYTGRPTFVADEEEQKRYMAKIHAQIFPQKGARLRREDIPGFPETLIDTRIYEPGSDFLVTGDGDNAFGHSERQAAERSLVSCLIPDIEDALENDNKVVVFLNYTDPLEKACELAIKKGWTVELIDGRQSGDKGDIERARIKKAFQENRLDVLFVNNQAGGAGLSLHDPTGKVERTAFISPAETGRQMKQVVGRVHRDGGAFSRQYFCGIKGTIQEQILLTNRKKLQNIDTLNDAEAETIIFS